MNYSENILGLIGNTPIVRLNKLTKGISATVLAKIESLNPGGSVKDRIGVSMIDAAERDGRLKPGGTVVEATSGNTGIGVALVCAVRGYKAVFVMTDKCSVEKVRYLKALGADVVVVPVAAKPDSPDHYVNTARRIAQETPISLFVFQYGNPANPEAHYRSTGPELWEQTGGKITHFVSGVGTGGTISGTGRYLKEKNSNIRIIGADPYGSVFKTFKETGKLMQATPYLVEGIGQEVVPPNVHIEYVDEVINVTDGESFELSRQLGRTEGIFCGGSSGTNLAAALREARDLDESAVVVFIVCDTGEHYLTKHHSDEWLKEKRLLEPQRMTAGLISGTKAVNAPQSLVFVTPQDKLSEALTKMNELGLTQIPVLEDGRPVGSLRENRVLAKVVRDRHLLEAAVSEVMEASFPTVDVDASAHEVTQRLQKSPAVLVEEYGRITGIITRHDVLDLRLGNTGSLV